MVVDDEPAIRLICRVNLGALGLRVVEAAGAEEAVSIARREQIDLILLDVMLPEADGFEVAEQLAADKRTAEVPVAFLSARTDPVDVERGLALGAVAYFIKPFDPIALSSEVDVLLERLKTESRDEVRADARRRHSGQA